jgi:hypothetical protein
VRDVRAGIAGNFPATPRRILLHRTANHATLTLTPDESHERLRENPDTRSALHQTLSVVCISREPFLTLPVHNHPRSTEVCFEQCVRYVDSVTLPQP